MITAKQRTRTRTRNRKVSMKKKKGTKSQTVIATLKVQQQLCKTAIAYIRQKPERRAMVGVYMVMRSYIKWYKDYKQAKIDLRNAENRKQIKKADLQIRIGRAAALIG